ncbi:MAG: hypothetical protein IJC21_03430, partial [Lentisphaeria bacterium]|nr:hypothetical protein [Lentisphaeria bacterium]
SLSRKAGKLFYFSLPARVGNKAYQKQSDFLTPAGRSFLRMREFFCFWLLVIVIKTHFFSFGT